MIFRCIIFMSIKIDKANKGNLDQKNNLGKLKYQKDEQENVDENKRVTLSKNITSRNLYGKKQKAQKKSSPDIESQVKKQKKVQVKSKHIQQDKDIGQNRNNNRKVPNDLNKIQKHKGFENSENSDSDITVQSNNRQKSVLISINKQNSVKNAKSLTQNQEKNINSKDSKPIKKYLFFNKNQAEIIKNQQKLKPVVNTGPQLQTKDKKMNNKNNQFVDHEDKSQSQNYIYQKHVHQKGQDKFFRLKNKLGFIFDMANNDENVSVSYYSQSNSHRSDSKDRKNAFVQSKKKTITIKSIKKENKSEEKQWRQIMPKAEVVALKQSTHKQQQKEKLQKKSYKQIKLNKVIEENMEYQKNEKVARKKSPIETFNKVSLNQQMQQMAPKKSNMTKEQQALKKSSESPKFQIKLQKVQTEKPYFQADRPKIVIKKAPPRVQSKVNAQFHSKSLNVEYKYRKQEQVEPKIFAQNRPIRTEEIENSQIFQQKTKDDYLDEQLMKIIQKNDQYLGSQKPKFDRYEMPIREQSSNSVKFSQYFPRRRLKTQMNQREDDKQTLTDRQKTFLKLLKRREIDLLEKIKQQYSNNPHKYLGDSYQFKNKTQNIEYQKEILNPKIQMEAINERRLNPSTNSNEISKFLPVLSTTTTRSKINNDSQLIHSPILARHQRKQYQYFSNQSKGYTLKPFRDSQHNGRYRIKQEDTTQYQQKKHKAGKREYKTYNIRQKYQKLKRIVERI